MNGHGIEKDMRRTYRTRVHIGNTPCNWVEGRTDSDVFRAIDALSKIVETPVSELYRSAFVYDPLLGEPAVFKYAGTWVTENDRVPVVLWIVKEY